MVKWGREQKGDCIDGRLQQSRERLRWSEGGESNDVAAAGYTRHFFPEGVLYWCKPASSKYRCAMALRQLTAFPTLVWLFVANTSRKGPLVNVGDLDLYSVLGIQWLCQGKSRGNDPDIVGLFAVVIVIPFFSFTLPSPFEKTCTPLHSSGWISEVLFLGLFI